MTEPQTDTKNEISLDELKSFIIETVPAIKPLIDTASAANERKLKYELAFLLCVITLGGFLIWAFIQNGKPDTAEKIIFALLGFLGGRGFIFNK